MSRFLVNPFLVMPSGPKNITGFGTKYANPSVLTNNQVFGTMFNNDDTAVVLGSSGTSPNIVAHTWSGSGFGTKYSDGVGFPLATHRRMDFNNANSVVLVSVQTNPPIAAYNWSSGWGSAFTNPAGINSAAAGRTSIFNSSENTVFNGFAGSLATPYFAAWPWSGSGFGTRYANAASTVPGQVQSLALNNDNNVVILPHATSPFISAYNWSSGWGSKFANPASAMPGQGNDAIFNENSTELIVSSAITPFINAYVWSSGFSTKYSNPVNLPAGSGNSVTFSKNYKQVFVSHTTTPFMSMYDWSGGFGSRYSNPSVLIAGDGQNASFTSDNSALVIGHSITPFVSAYSLI